ncbi:MAG: 6-phospho-3-hexuloisomerase [Methanobacteriota archaeon]|jgi:6-phospho 3-hexuloisomerase
MDVLKEAMSSIAQHVENVANSLDKKQINALLNSLEKANKVFVYGAGRSGLVARAFAMRLMHLGINVFVIGETVTPAIGEGDLLITISGSGETTSVVNAARIAKNVKAKVALITSYPNSSTGKLADYVVVVKGRTKLLGDRDFLMRQIKGEHYSLAPLGTLFEISVLIFLDSLIAELMMHLKKSEDYMRMRHATIE